MPTVPASALAAAPSEPKPGVPTRVRGGKGGLRAAAREIVAYRELLRNLIRKELKVRYKNSALGFFWSLLNPALRLVIFYIVFQVILGSGIDNFAIFLLAGLLVWNLFTEALGGAVGSVVANAPLVKKVYFPREILPLASVGAALVNFFLQSIVLVIAMVVLRLGVDLEYLVLVPAALATLLLLATALSLFVSAVNVYLRDTQHLLELALMAWFWLTPIVYPFRLVTDKLGGRGWVALLNPVTPIVIAFQRAIYNDTESVRAGVVTPILPPDAGMLWYLRNLGIVAGVSTVLGIGAFLLFRRLEGNFAEEL